MVRERLALLAVLGAAAALLAASGALAESGGRSAMPKELLVFATAGDENLAVVRADGTGVRYVTRFKPATTPIASPAVDGPSWSPDHVWVAFTRLATRRTGVAADDASKSVFIVGADGSGLRRLGSGTLPSWAPDSRHLVYVDLSASPHPTRPPKPAEADELHSGLLRSGAITVASLDGNTRRIAVGTSPTWSPDGRTIAYMRYRLSPYHLTGSDWTNEVTGSTLTLVRPDGAHARVLFQESGGERSMYAPHWAPDASALAVAQALPDRQLRDSTSFHLVTVNATTGRTRRFLALDTPIELQTGYEDQGRIRWSPDSKKILVAVHRSPRDHLAIVDVAHKSSRFLANSPNRIGSVAWSPDGSRIAYAQCGPNSSEAGCVLMIAKPDGTQASRVAHAPNIREFRFGLMNKLDWNANS